MTIAEADPRSSEVSILIGQFVEEGAQRYGTSPAPTRRRYGLLASTWRAEYSLSHGSTGSRWGAEQSCRSILSRQNFGAFTSFQIIVARELQLSCSDGSRSVLERVVFGQFDWRPVSSNLKQSRCMNDSATFRFRIFHHGKTILDAAVTQGY